MLPKKTKKEVRMCLVHLWKDMETEAKKSTWILVCVFFLTFFFIFAFAKEERFIGQWRVVPETALYLHQSLVDTLCGSLCFPSLPSGGKRAIVSSLKRQGRSNEHAASFE